MVSFPYYSHIFRDSYGNSMGSLPKGGLIIGGPWKSHWKFEQENHLNQTSAKWFFRVYYRGGTQQMIYASPAVESDPPPPWTTHDNQQQKHPKDPWYVHLPTFTQQKSNHSCI